MANVVDGSFVAYIEYAGGEVSKVFVGEKRGEVVLHSVTLFCGDDPHTQTRGEIAYPPESFGGFYDGVEKFIDEVVGKLTEGERALLARGCYLSWFNTDAETGFHKELEKFGGKIHSTWDLMNTAGIEVGR